MGDHFNDEKFVTFQQRLMQKLFVIGWLLTLEKVIVI